MRRVLPTQWFILALFALIYSACDNEPLEGEFPQQEENPAGEGQFVAVINNDGFQADEAVATLDQNNTLNISGTNTSTGENITITVQNGAEGTFDLTSGTGTLNIALYFDGQQDSNPYTTAAELGGFGQLQVTEVNADSLTVSGTFSINAVRQAVDENGAPVVDGDGNPVVENVSISNGAFNQIPYTIVSTGGGGGGGNNAGSFFAKVDGLDFVADSVTTSRTLINEVVMIQVQAFNSEGQKIRLDIPEDLGTGTFEMVSISDGTQLIGIYDPNLPGVEDLTSNPGTITINSFNTLAGRIEATFAFTASDPLGVNPNVAEITEGAFDVRYTPAESSPENSMQVDVDGVTWNATAVDVFELDLSGVPTLRVRGFNSDSGELITFIFPMDLEPGSYDFVTETVAGEPVARFYPVLGGTEYTSTDGSLVVLSNELMTGGALEAGFLFLAEDLTGSSTESFSLTNGLFTVILP